MKTLLLLVFFAYSANAALLGAKQCTWGPSYWCSNITAAAGCNAVKHCIQTVWEHKKVEPDSDSVCETCKKMVQEARDQLESNETQEEIKEVFEGSCNLLPVKIIRKECCKLADDFIVELVDTLASQMNPQVVCSVAGLCNSVRIDNLLAAASVESEGTDESEEASDVATLQDTCAGCHKVVDIMQQRFQAMTKDQFLKFVLQICGRMSSLSDACSNIVLNYFEDIYTHMLNNFNSNNVCLMAGECSTQFHVHNVEITPMSKTGVVPNKPISDDLPCDLCKQLVGHLRDLLIANTTESEFKKVMIGLCKQTKSNFQKQCLAWVDEYYQVVYNYLVTQLDSNAICKDINICPGGSSLLGDKSELQPIVPLVPIETVDRYASQKAQESQRGPIEIVQRPELMQLPIERVFLAPLYDKKVCVFCQYFLHYVQQAITEPDTEKEIKEIIDRACVHLPSVVNNTCIDFVNTYGEAVLALLAQDIDPSVVCPLIRLCPSVDVSAGGAVEVFMENTGDIDNGGIDGEKPKCGLCLFAVTRLEELVKDQKTVGNIKSALNGLCSHFSGEIQLECKDFVNTYTDELVDMMIADFTPQEVCVYLQLCDDKMPPKPLELSEQEHQIMTNEIPDNTINGIPFEKSSTKKPKASPQCVLCEFVMSKLQDDLKNKTTQDEIKKAVHNVCHLMPKSVRKECDSFVDKYADSIIVLLESAIEPEQICEMMELCEKKKLIVKNPIKDVDSLTKSNVGGGPYCFICKYIIQKVEEITPPVNEPDFINSLEHLCSLAPHANKADCKAFIDKAGHEIYNLLKIGTEPTEICGIILLCATNNFDVVRSEVNLCGLCHATVLSADTVLSEVESHVGSAKNIRKGCYSLPGLYVPRCMKIMNHYHDDILAALSRYEDSASICLSLKLCNGTEFLGRMKRSQLLGAKKCTWGPSYWCENNQQAQECGSGAVKHCQAKVWLQNAAP